MAIVKRVDSLGRKYHFNTTTSTRTTEASYNRSKSSAKSAKTQFKTASGYACSSAGINLVKKRSSAAGKKLRTC